MAQLVKTKPSLVIRASAWLIACYARWCEKENSYPIWRSDVRLSLSVWFILGAGIFCCAAAPAADNAITNPEFNAGVEIDGWSMDYGLWWVWSSSNDADSCVASGSGWGASAFLPDPDPPNGLDKQYLRIYAPGCWVVSPGQAMWIQFDYWTVAPYVRVVVWPHPTLNCVGGVGGFYFWTIGMSGDGWAHADIPLSNSLNAASVSVQIDAWSLAGDQDFSLFVDRVYLGAADRIFSDDFEGGGATPFCRWSATSP